MRRKRRDIFGDGKYLVCAGEEERRSKRRKTFRMKYLKRVIILSAEEKKSIKRKGTNNMEMMIQLDMMVKKHDANSWSKRHFNAKCTLKCCETIFFICQSTLQLTFNIPTLFKP